MKKRYLIIGLLAASFSSNAQQRDSTYTKKKITQTDAQVLFSYYTQDNNHSAVTGGKGTEDLQVYTTQASLDFQKDSVRTIHLDCGVDVITSASTDKIDFVMSSASRVDARTHINVGYNRFYKGPGVHAGINGSFSIESDYTSFGSGVSWAKISRDQSREVSVVFQAYFDDLRWGRLENGHPQKLVYPEELRYKDWFDNYRRNSYNLSAGLYQTVNKRTSIGIYPGFSYQSGLLSTPFHRVYFTDNSERVEKLPNNRLKIPVGLQLNKFLGSRWILRTYYRFYWDNFGITAHTLNVEAPVKIDHAVTVIAFVRLYEQQQADYFMPYAKHTVSDEFYTSDYDLSSFTSYKTGVGFRYAPFQVKRNFIFKEAEIRYAFYKRSDGLAAHMITTFFNIGRSKRPS